MQRVLGLCMQKLYSFAYKYARTSFVSCRAWFAAEMWCSKASCFHHAYHTCRSCLGLLIGTLWIPAGHLSYISNKDGEIFNLGIGSTSAQDLQSLQS